MRGILWIGCIVMAGSVSASTVVKQVIYKQGDQVLEGYYVYDDAVKGSRPGVVIVHDWKGVKDYEIGRAKQLVGLGYTAFVADIYGQGIRPKTAGDAGKQAGKYKGDRPLFQARLLAAYDQLVSNPHTDKRKVAAIGYCFGGTGVLELARTGAKLRGVVSFHGGLDIQDLGKAHCQFAILHGADDPFVPKKDIDHLMGLFESAKIKPVFVAYPGAVHAFTVPDAGNDPKAGAAYNAEADHKSWDEMKNFLHRVFK